MQTPKQWRCEAKAYRSIAEVASSVFERAEWIKLAETCDRNADAVESRLIEESNDARPIPKSD